MSRTEQPLVEWKEVVAATSEGIAILQGERVVHANDSFAAHHGYDDPTAVEDSRWKTLYPQGERDRLESKAFPAARRDGEWHGHVQVQAADERSHRHELTLRAPNDEVLIATVREPAPASAQEPGREDADSEYRRLFDSAPVPIGVVTAEDGIVYCNQAAVEFLGGDDRDAIVGRPPEAFVSDDSAARISERFDTVLQERESTSPLEERLVTLEGEERQAIVSSAPATYDGAPAAQVVMKDVTELARVRDRLRREQRFVRTVIDAIDDILYVIDEDGEPYLWNESLAETTGYSHDEIETMAPKDFLPESQHEFVPGLMEAISATEDRRVELDVLTKDGDRIPHEFNGTTFEDPVSGDVFRCGLARDITDRLERERELERYERIVETVDDGVYALDEDRRFSFVNEGLCRLLDRPREDLLGTPVDVLFESRAEFDTATEIRDRAVEGESPGASIRATAPDGERVLEANYRLNPPAADTFQGSVGVIRDITEQLERERALETQRDELSTLTRINDLLFGLIHGLVEMQSRDAIERLVCERLVESDRFGFAWTGERTLENNIAPLMSAGDGDGYFESLVGSDETIAGDGPAGRAIHRKEPQVERLEATDSEWWAQVAADHGFESLVAVPVRHRDTVYGVFVVLSTQPDAFSDRVADGLEVLGKTVGLAIDAIERRRLLFADAVTEIELDIAAPDSFLARAAESCDCRLTVSAYENIDDRWVFFVDVADGDIDSLAQHAATADDVDRVRVIGDDTAEKRMELIMSRESIFDRIVPTGVHLRSLAFDRGEGRVVVDAPADVTVRDVIEKLDSTFDGVTLRSRRERERSVTGSRGSPGAVEALTDRQREVLEVAYHAGYFSWPRENTAERVADMLDIAAPTFHAHVRKAEEALLSSVLE